MGGDGLIVSPMPSASCLNPPRPHGRGQAFRIILPRHAVLKSTPPAWAGTEFRELMYYEPIA